MLVTCRLPKDGGLVCNQQTRVDHKDKIEWSNAMTHLRSTHKTFVRPEHKKPTAEEAAGTRSEGEGQKGRASLSAIAIVAIVGASFAWESLNYVLSLSLQGPHHRRYRLWLSLPPTATA